MRKILLTYSSLALLIIGGFLTTFLQANSPKYHSIVSHRIGDKSFKVFEDTYELERHIEILNEDHNSMIIYEIYQTDTGLIVIYNTEIQEILK